MDNISVAIRVRPLINREKGAAAKIHWKTETDLITQIDADGKPKGKCYNFDRVYDVTETTTDVYEEVAQPIVQAAMQGYDGTIFAYGQTSSGKTFTMHGNEENPGIIPLTVEEIFKTIQETPEREFLLRAYYVELYNECLMDLLVSNDNKELKIREVEMTLNGVTKYRVTLTNQEEVVCTKVSEILALIKKGDENRHVGRTNMNEHSSRSHSIFCIIIESRKRTAKRESGDGCVMMSHLYLVDLAGSEKADETKARGQRLKEACKINQSLFSLSNVIQKLSRGESHIPFRDSKLTRLLQSSLGGNAKTAIICAVTPAAIDQTHSTLQFASRAKEIKNTATVNEIVSDEAMMQRLKKELHSMKAKIDALQKGGMEELQTERDDLARSLDAKSEMIRAHEEKIRYLSSIVLVSSNVNEAGPTKKKKLRRETWCPGSMKVGSPITKDIASAGLDFSSMAPLLPFQQLPKDSLKLANANHDFGKRLPSVPEAQASPPSTSKECVEVTSSVDDFPAFPTEECDSVFCNSMVTDRHDFPDEEKLCRKRRRTVRFADPVQEETTDFQLIRLANSLASGPRYRDYAKPFSIASYQVHDLQTQLQETMSMCESLLDEKNTLEALIDDKDEQYRQLQYEFDVLKVDCDIKDNDQSDDMIILQQELQNKQKLIDHLEISVKEYKKELHELKDFTKLESGTIKEQEGEYKAEIQSLQEYLQERDTKITEMNSTLDQMREVQELSFENKSLVDAEFMVMDLRKKLSEATDNNKLMTQQMEIIQSDIKKLNHEKGDFDSHILFEKERHQRMCDELKDQLQKAYDENAALSAASSNCVDTQNAMGIRKADECSAETEVLKAELEQYKKTIQELNDKKAELQSDLELSIDSNIEAQQQFMEVQEDLEQKVTLIKQLQDQLVNSNTELAENSGRVEDLHGIIEKLERELDTIRSQQDPDEHIKELQLNIKENDCTIKDLRHKLEMSQTTSTCSVELEKRVEELENSNANKDSIICDLKQELETLQMGKVYSEKPQGCVKELENEVLEWSDSFVKIEDEMEVKTAYLEKQLVEQRHNSISHVSLDPDERIKELQLKIKENDCTIEDLKHKLEMSQTANTCSVELEKRIVELENCNANKDSITCDLKQELEHLQMGKMYSEELQGRVKELENEVLARSNRCAKIEAEMEVKTDYLEKQLAEQRHNSTSHDVSLSTTEITKQEVEILTELNMELESKVAELTQQLDTSTKAIGNNSQDHIINDLQTQLSEAKNYQLVAERLEEKIANLIKENQMKVNELSEELVGANEMKVNVGHLQVQVHELEKCLTEANSYETEANQLKGIVEELSKQLELASETKVRNIELQGKIEDLEMQLSGMNNFKLLAEQNAKKVEDLTKQLHLIKRQSVDDNDWLQMQVEELEKQLRESNMYKSLAEDLKMNVIDLETQLAEAGDYQTTAKELEQRVAFLTEKMEGKSDEENMFQVQITDLEQQLIEARGYQTEAQDLGQKVDELKTHIKEAEIEHEQVVAMMKDANKQEIESLTTHIEKNKKYKENIAQLELAEAQHTSRIQALEKQLIEYNTGTCEAEELRMKNKELTDQVCIAEIEIQRITDDLTLAKQSNEEIVSLQTKVASMEQQITKGQAYLSQLLDERKEAQQASEENEAYIGEIEQVLEENKEELQTLTQTCEEKLGQVLELEQQLADAHDYQSQLVEELNTAKQSVDEELSKRNQLESIKAEQSELLEQLNATKVMCLEKENLVTELSEKVANVRTNEIRLTDELNSMKQYSTEAESLHIQIAELQKESSKIKKQLSKTEALLSVAQQKCEDKDWLEVEVAELKKRIPESECVQLELKEAKCAIETYQKRVDVLSKELNDAKQQHERSNNEYREFVRRSETEEKRLTAQLTDASLETKRQVEKLSADHKKHESDLYDKRMKEERFLQNIIEEVDEELSIEKKQHKETKEKLDKLKESFEALKSEPPPADIKVLEKKIAEQDIKIVGYEYDLQMVKDDRDQRVCNFIKDAEYYNSHIQKLQAQIDDFKKMESCTSKPAAETATTSTKHPVIGNTSSSGVILEHEFFFLKHQKEKLTKANAKLEKENVSTGIRCAALEDKMIKIERDMNHYKTQAKIYYSKYHSVIDSNSKQASTSSEPVARALQDINETGGERSPLRRHVHDPTEYYTEQIPGWQPPQETTTKKGIAEWPHCDPKHEEEPAECKQS